MTRPLGAMVLGAVVLLTGCATVTAPVHTPPL
jgi:hypothetical protein